MVGNVNKRFEVCRYVRNIASQSCLRTFQHTINSIKKVSELQFRNRWYKELARIKNINPSGWYNPPKYGMGVLFGTEKDFDRVNYPTLRNKEFWPDLKSYFDKKNGVGYIFASPYALLDSTPIIGDFGFTFYNGDNNKIKAHYSRCYRILSELIESIQIGTSFKQLYDSVINRLQKEGLRNYVMSTTDPAGMDIGHTVPFISDVPSQQLIDSVSKGNESNIHKLINKARRFISAQEDFIISQNCAFTFEPRIIVSDGKKMPMFSLHTIIQFVQGVKIILSNFDGLINLFGMQWIYT